MGGVFTHLLKTHPVGIEYFQEIQWDESDLYVEEISVTHSTRKKPCRCSGVVATSLSSGKNLVKCVDKCSSSHGNAIPERKTTVST